MPRLGNTETRTVVKDESLVYTVDFMTSVRMMMVLDAEDLVCLG